MTMPALVSKLENLTVDRKLALVIRLCEAEAVREPFGTEPHLDTLFWLGLEDLCREMLREVEELQKIAGVKICFVMLPDAARDEADDDEKGGAG